MSFFLVLLYLQQRANLVDFPAGFLQTRVAAESSAAGMRVMRATKALSAPVLDGRLDDPIWLTVPVATDFTQNYPQRGVPATRRTEARVVFVGDAVYVGMRAYDSPDSILAPLARRDAN